ncbi:MAG: DUF3501 family protein [Candidatus Neomarinimicrobiota bacterium]|nr:DUF3501 family protein [Candidatus Neomarinimicrobiota bacterium]
MLKRSDLMNIIEYEKVRKEYRKDIILYKKNRRIKLGPNITITFENMKTIKFQIQEMMRAERMVHDHQIQEELDIYNSLLPPKNGLSATLFIEVTEQTKIKKVLNQFIGLTEGNNLFFQINDEKVFSQFEKGREEKDKISSVHYISFILDEVVKQKFLNKSREIFLCVSYNNYEFSELISSEMHLSLVDDLNL